MSSIWVDALLAVLLVGAALRGWRGGAVRLVFIVAGFWVGASLGFLALPLLADLATGVARTVLFLVWLLFATLTGTACGEAAGAWAHRHHLFEHGPVARGDQAVGAVLGLLAGAVVLWLAGTLLAASAPAWLGRPLQGSRVLRTMDSVMPDPPSLFSRIDSLLNHSGFPVVLVNLPPGLAERQPLPGAAAVEAAAAAVRASTVKVTTVACGIVRSGSGFVAEGDLVVTNAHVVAGAETPSVTDGSGTHAASVAAYDPGLDVAILRVPGLADPPAAVSTEPLGPGAPAAIAGYPEGGGLQVVPAAVDARFTAVGLDIYGTSITSRDVYELHAEVRPGDSGGPLVAVAEPPGDGAPAVGTVVGVVFSRSATDPSLGYALAMAPVVSELAAARAAPGAVATGACLP